MRRGLNIAVVGAGTAGLSAAVALRQQGHVITLFERQSNLAPVGAGILLQPQALRVMAEWGVSAALKEQADEIYALKLFNHRNSCLVDIDYRSEPAYGVSRVTLLGVLSSTATKLGVRFEFGQKISSVVPAARSAEGCLAYGAEGWKGPLGRYDIVVLASGSNSELAVELGLGAPAKPYAWGALNGLVEMPESWPCDILEQRVQGAATMMGLLPSGQVAGRRMVSLYWSLPTTRYGDWKDLPWETRLQAMRNLWPQAEPILEKLQDHELSFATYRHARPKNLQKGRVVLVGDVAHSMSPQLGLGSTLAMQDAQCLAQLLGSRELGVDKALDQYQAVRLPAVKRVQRLSQLLTPLFQSRLPAVLRDPWFQLANKFSFTDSVMKRSLGLSAQPG